ncbi:MAG TPA: PQQ-dependent sugar dehydrogenase, partial [Pirellulales bacterium]|nr:PQQ-dependent sugar dehydrogenase [Pirellulales bacterium]
HHRVSRFTVRDDRADPATEKLLLAGDDQTKMGGAVPAGHQGGGIHFGRDGKLYVAIGEQTAGAPAQKLDTFLGKLLRIHADGSIPADNPFYETAHGKYRAIWCYGLRNPFAFAVHRDTGRMLINDVGGSRFEEINEAERGANYGWPITEGPTVRSQYKNPLHAYSLGGKQSISGGTFYEPRGVIGGLTSPRSPRFPAKYIGKYFFAEYMHGWIKTIDPDRPHDVQEFAAGLAGPVDLRVGPDGCLYVLCRNAWVKDDKFQPNTGSLMRIAYDGVTPGRLPQPGGDAQKPLDLPRLLSQTGIFRSLETLEPMPGAVPYDVNTPLWSDGAMKRRWIILPEGRRIETTPDGAWRFPQGTMFVKHFELGSEPTPQAARRRLETRVLVVDGRGLGHGATYRWREDGSDAELLDEARTETVAYSARQGATSQNAKWSYPSRQDCLVCHTEAAGFVLGVNPRQLDREFDYGSGVGSKNQLAEWSRLGMFDRPVDRAALSSHVKLAALDDQSASLEHRVRSYLEANCAGCHRPGGVRAEFDARVITPLDKQGLIGGKLVAADLGIDGAKVVVPGDRTKSMLYLRMTRREQDAYNMPPLASHLVDEQAADVVGQWIDSLDDSQPADVSSATDSASVQTGTGKASGTRAGTGKLSGTHDEADSGKKARFLRLHWFELGLDHGNPPVNGRFRVNAPEAVLHAEQGSRQEAKGNGMMLIRADEDPRKLAAAELYCELWGGHPGTSAHRVTINGRSTYKFDVPGQADCTHLYPTIPLKLTDLVNGYNALQFACDTGTTFWGHFIVDNACLRVELRADDAEQAKFGLNLFAAAVEVTDDVRFEQYKLSLRVNPADAERISAVHFQGYYDGYDENGDGRTLDWHGYTKRRRPTAVIATTKTAPFSATWDVSMLPAQTGLKVRALVEFDDLPNLLYETASVSAPPIAENRGGTVSVHHAADLPHPFWSRANKKQTCTIDVPIDPARIERAELHVVVWDGGAGGVSEYFTLNGKFLPVADQGRHDVLYRRLRIEPSLLRRGKNTIELLSDTDHHGIEVLLPGPALVLRTKRNQK